MKTGKIAIILAAGFLLSGPSIASAFTIYCPRGCDVNDETGAGHYGDGGYSYTVPDSQPSSESRGEPDTASGSNDYSGSLDYSLAEIEAEKQARLEAAKKQAEVDADMATVPPNRLAQYTGVALSTLQWAIERKYMAADEAAKQRFYSCALVDYGSRNDELEPYTHESADAHAIEVRQDGFGCQGKANILTVEDLRASGFSIMALDSPTVIYDKFKDGIADNDAKLSVRLHRHDADIVPSDLAAAVRNAALTIYNNQSHPGAAAGALIGGVTDAAGSVTKSIIHNPFVEGLGATLTLGQWDGN